MDLRKAGATDDLQHTVNYAEVFRCEHELYWKGHACAACKWSVHSPPAWAGRLQLLAVTLGPLWRGRRGISSSRWPAQLQTPSCSATPWCRCINVTPAVCRNLRPFAVVWRVHACCQNAKMCRGAVQSCCPLQAASIRVDKPQAPVVGMFDTIGERSLQLPAGPCSMHATYIAAACTILLCVLCCSRRADTVTALTHTYGTDSISSDATTPTSAGHTGEDVQILCR